MADLEKMVEKHPGVIIENSEHHTDSKADTKEARLAEREKEVLQLIGEGKSTNQIASKLNISPKIMSAHKASLRLKLIVRTTGITVSFAKKAGN